jgi:magnesium chelatase family protein
MASEDLGESSADVRKRVELARAIASDRFARSSWKLNSQIPPEALRKEFRATKSGMNLLNIELEKERISARGFHKVLRVAWSIADSAGHVVPDESDVAQAYGLREGLEFLG